MPQTLLLEFHIWRGRDQLAARERRRKLGKKGNFILKKELTSEAERGKKDPRRSKDRSTRNAILSSRKPRGVFLAGGPKFGRRRFVCGRVTDPSEL